MNSAIAQSEVWSQLNAQLIAESKRKKRLNFLADVWSQSEFWIQQNAEQKTDPKSEMTQCVCANKLPVKGVSAHDQEMAQDRWTHKQSPKTGLQ